MAVVSFVPTLLALIHAVVSLDIDFLQTDTLAMVTKCLYISHYTANAYGFVKGHQHKFHCVNTIEIDECSEGTAGCAQTCTNTPGSYTCSCRSGFMISRDSHGCDGIHKMSKN